MLWCPSIVRTLFQWAKSHRSDWTNCLTYLESTFSLLGYLGVDIFVNKMLNSHVGPTRLHEEFLCNELLDWVFGDNEDDLLVNCYKQVMSLNQKSCLLQWLRPWLWVHLLLSATNSACRQPNPPPLILQLPAPAPTSSTCRFALPKAPSWLYRNYTGSAEIRAILLTNQIAVFRIGRL